MDAFGFLFWFFFPFLFSSYLSTLVDTHLLPAKLHCVPFHTTLYSQLIHPTMRFHFLMLLAAVATVALAREDTAELCTGALSCDAGYCCSSQ